MRRRQNLICLLLATVLLLFSSCRSVPENEETDTRIPPENENTTADSALGQKSDALCASLLLASPAENAAPEDAMLAVGFDRCTGVQLFRQLRAEKKYGVSPDNIFAARTAFDSAIKSGCRLIMTDSALGAVSAELAGEYPDVAFICRSDSALPADNIYTCSAKYYEAFYLAGIAAALRTQSNRLAFIAAAGTPQAVALNMANGFTLGARTVSENISVYLKYTDENTDAPRCLSALCAMGCDVAVGNFADPRVYTTAKRLNCDIFAFDAEEIIQDNPAVIGTISADYSAYFTSCIQKAVVDDADSFTDFYGGLAENAVVFRPNPDYFDARQQQRLHLVRQAIADGSFAVFSGYCIAFSEQNDEMQIFPSALRAADDTIREPGDDPLQEEEIRTHMRFFADGLTER